MYVDLNLRFLGNPGTQIFGIVVKLGAARCNKLWVHTLVRPVHCTPDDDDVVDTAPVQSLVVLRDRYLRTHAPHYRLHLGLGREPLYYCTTAAGVLVPKL